MPSGIGKREGQGEGVGEEEGRVSSILYDGRSNILSLLLTQVTLTLLAEFASETPGEGKMARKGIVFLRS